MKKEKIFSSNFSITKLKSIDTTAKILKKYNLRHAKVSITSDGLYNVALPPISEKAERMLLLYMDGIYEKFSGVSDQDHAAVINQYIDSAEMSKDEFEVWRKERDIIQYYLHAELDGYRNIDVLMNDPKIEDIICTGYGKAIGIIHKDFPDMKMLETNIRFSTSDDVNEWIQIISTRYGRPPTFANPITYGSTPENHRITFVGQHQISPNGPSFAIRKFPKHPLVITHLINDGVISLEFAAYIWMIIDATPFVLIVGETGSGKTTLINALMCLSDPRMHVMVIEDTRELKIPHYWTEYNIVTEGSSIDVANTNTTNGNKKGTSIMDLVRMTLRKKPHFVLIGEVRGEETREMFQGAVSGHGAMTSFHAAGVPETFARLQSSPINITKNQLMNLWAILHISKLQTQKGKTARRMLKYVEIHVDEKELKNNDNSKYEKNDYDDVSYKTIFEYDHHTDKILPTNTKDIINKSKKIQYAVNRFGVSDITAELNRRKAFLKRCIDSNAYTVQSVFDITSKCYKRPRPSKEF